MYIARDGGWHVDFCTELCRIRRACPCQIQNRAPRGLPKAASNAHMPTEADLPEKQLAQSAVLCLSSVCATSGRFGRTVLQMFSSCMSKGFGFLVSATLLFAVCTWLDSLALFLLFVSLHTAIKALISGLLTARFSLQLRCRSREELPLLYVELVSLGSHFVALLTEPRIWELSRICVHKAKAAV